MSTALPTRRAACVVALVLATVTTGVAGCADAVDGAARVDGSQVSAYRAAVSSSAAASAERERSDADYAVCSTATRAAASMLAAYNTFVRSLNATQDYAALKGADLAAVGALDRGVGDIRGSLRPTNSDAVRTAATGLADRSAALAGVVRAKGRGELNAASGAFLQARDGLLGACRAFDAPASSAAPSSPIPSSAPR